MGHSHGSHSHGSSEHVAEEGHSHGIRNKSDSHANGELGDASDSESNDELDDLLYAHPAAARFDGAVVFMTRKLIVYATEQT